ncbi:MAG: ATP-dependent DNA helicase RecG, partial [Prevotellaceae bacterium]|nr:ATP-dependent DNA helicase RecG [Prevotellaceae bacterium]
MFLSQSILYLPGVGTKRAAVLEQELNIRTVEDLLCHYPYRYIDRSRFYYLHEIGDLNTFYQVRGQIVRFERKGEGHKQRLTAIFTDGHQTVELVWFKGIKYVTDKVKTNTEYILFGQPSLFNGKFNFAHPELELPANLPPATQLGLQPYYNTTEKMKHDFLNSKAIQKIMFPLVQNLRNATVAETLPDYLLQKYRLLGRKEALINIHFPANEVVKQQAERRFKFEELFYMQLLIGSYVSWREAHINGFRFVREKDFFTKIFYNKYLPFQLTGAQIKVLNEIREDLGAALPNAHATTTETVQMNRLLQGDVGSGKTIVALLVMLMAVDNGFQAALMAPTEILATQHFESITALLGDLGVKVALLTGSTKKKDREMIHSELLSGEINILLGTHALIEDTVKFKNLGMIIIDEQHRFGVEQRAKMWKKNDKLAPHVLVMTATPIPRTLAMTVYGDLKVSNIRELPAGRIPIKTFHFFENNRQKVNQLIYQEVQKGRQAYIVYPIIEESEKVDWKNLYEGYNYMCETFPEYHVSMIHGKMKPAEKDEQMRRFVAGETQIMVATTVIEVGVNVPNASVMLIEDADRFGLSQLHQLRGRVGRGSEQSYCILLTKYELAKNTRERMATMVR